MIAALKRNLRSQESTKEGAVSSWGDWERLQRRMHTYFGLKKKSKNFPGRKWKKCILAKEMASNSVKKY